MTGEYRMHEIEIVLKSVLIGKLRQVNPINIAIQIEIPFTADGSKVHCVGIRQTIVINKCLSLYFTV